MQKDPVLSQDTRPADLLRLIPGDQLHRGHSWFARPEADVLYLLAEARSETDYAQHHIQKVAALFLSMRRFAAELQAAGHRVRYLTLSDMPAHHTLADRARAVAAAAGAKVIEAIRPDEYRLIEQLSAAGIRLKDSEHFLYPRVRHPRLPGRMEGFYREMRRTTGILMQGSDPHGGKFNFDSENRKKLPDSVHPPEPWTSPVPEAALNGVLREIHDAGIRTIGSVSAFLWPTDRDMVLSQLNHFIQNLLPSFGDYQDAMTYRSRFVFHSGISFALNTKMLHPMEVIRAAEESEAPLPAREGFIRQILGWREYVRLLYNQEMPEYSSRNFLEHDRPLPSWYWTGHTDMACMKFAITSSLESGYAHHISRLMLTGNFALLLGVHPDAVDAWYLGIYVDAFEWVQLPNTRGMSQYADGGLLASKPYIASGAYIHKMSDFCRSCRYNVRERTSASSCPFNALYWEFLDRHKHRIGSNARLATAYAAWNRFSESEKSAVRSRAEHIRVHAEML